MKKLHIALLFSLLFLLGGCLELDGQDVYLRYDDESDRIDAMFVHRGLFAEGGSGSSSDPMEKAFGDLQKARETGEFVFWGNWPLSCNPSRDYDAPRNALLKHVDVENGGLFTDPHGVMCGYQFVRINDAKAFVKKLNTLLEVGMQAALVKGINGHKLDDETKENLREFLRGRDKMLVLEKGRIELRLPLSAKDHAWLKDRLEEQFLDNMPREVTRREAVAQRRKAGGSPTDTTTTDETVTIEGTALKKEIERAPSYRFFWDNEFSFQRTESLTTLGIGVAGADELHVQKAMGGLYHGGFLDYLREKEEGKVEDGIPDQELFRRFEQFRGRDAELPPALAKKRG